VSKLKVKMVRSPIGYPRDQRATLNGLGLSHINQERELEDTPAVRGMIFKVKHLVVSDPPEAAQRKPQQAGR
jgi:large subunit ribosomal protein L30